MFPHFDVTNKNANFFRKEADARCTDAFFKPTKNLSLLSLLQTCSSTAKPTSHSLYSDFEHQRKWLISSFWMASHGLVHRDEAMFATFVMRFLGTGAVDNHLATCLALKMFTTYETGQKMNGQLFVFSCQSKMLSLKQRL